MLETHFLNHSLIDVGQVQLWLVAIPHNTLLRSSRRSALSDPVTSITTPYKVASVNASLAFTIFLHLWKSLFSPSLDNESFHNLLRSIPSNDLRIQTSVLDFLLAPAAASMLAYHVHRSRCVYAWSVCHRLIVGFCLLVTCRLHRLARSGFAAYGALARPPSPLPHLARVPPGTHLLPHLSTARGTRTSVPGHRSPFCLRCLCAKCHGSPPVATRLSYAPARPFRGKAVVRALAFPDHRSLPYTRG
jgi:hypothetical protein